MKKIYLKNKKYILIDNKYFNYLNKFKWSINSKNFACTKYNNKFITMHKLIMNTPNGLQIDHINGNRLDNRKCNLRICTCSQNCINRKSTTRNTSGYRGVTKHKDKWRVKIEVNRKKISLGCFSNIKEAAFVYNKAAKRYHGEFAVLNKI